MMAHAGSKGSKWQKFSAVSNNMKELKGNQQLTPGLRTKRASCSHHQCFSARRPLKQLVFRFPPSLPGNRLSFRVWKPSTLPKPGASASSSVRTWQTEAARFPGGLLPSLEDSLRLTSGSITSSPCETDPGPGVLSAPLLRAPAQV